MAYRVGIVGVSGYGGGELLRYLSAHPHFDLVYAAGESSAGTPLAARYPGLHPRFANLTVQKWDVGALPSLDVLFASLPTGESQTALAAIPANTVVVDIGGDHRFVPGWTYGLADSWPHQMNGVRRIANPGCYPAATLGALAPLARAGLIDASAPIIVDAKSGVSGAGRGGSSGGFGFSETSDDLVAYGVFKHAHVPEMKSALAQLGTTAPLVFTPHLVPMVRGILATCYVRAARSGLTAADCTAAAAHFYAGRPFVRVVDAPPHTKWAAGSNLLLLNYHADPATGQIIALAAIDNLGKGAAGQAVQNANLALGLDETAGLQTQPVWP